MCVCVCVKVVSDNAGGKLKSLIDPLCDLRCESFPLQKMLSDPKDKYSGYPIMSIILLPWKGSG